MIGVGVFLVTYVLVSARRIGWLGLDRPTAALGGAVAVVGLGVLGPDQAIAAVDGETLLLLLGVMGIGAFLVLDGVFDAVEARLAPLAARPAVLLAAVVWGAGGLAALVTNDAVCLLGTPLVLRIVRRYGLPPVPFLLALASGANTGSAATLVGNPQNMLCARLGGLQFLDHLLLVGPLVVLALAANQVVLAVLCELPPSREAVPLGPPAPLGRRQALTAGVLALTVVAWMVGAPLGWTAAGAFVLLLLAHRRDAREVWRHVDGPLLLFFAGLFVVVEGLRSTGAVDAVFARVPLEGLGTAGLAGVFVVGSNVVSNVPFILVVRDQLDGLPDPTRAWTLLAVASTFAGNLTLLGSAANVIVAEGAREVGGIGFREHLRVGVPVTLVTTAIAVLWLR
ncbi:MAG: hypothetical protein H6734_24650 [Alphaproteobacteria bacterium]|nr:hypothetical protein [Alphaproteobacteria bacterium]